MEKCGQLLDLGKQNLIKIQIAARKLGRNFTFQNTEREHINCVLKNLNWKLILSTEHSEQ